MHMRMALALVMILASALVVSCGTTTFNNQNGHVYELVDAGKALNFADASSLAGSRTFNGMQGYLVTITSAFEENVLNDIFSSETPKQVDSDYPTLWSGARREGNLWYWYALTRKSGSFYDVSSSLCSIYCDWSSTSFPDGYTCMQLYSQNNGGPTPGTWRPANCSSMSEDIIVEYDAGWKCNSGYQYNQSAGWCQPIPAATTPSPTTTTPIPSTTTTTPTPSTTTTTNAPSTTTDAPSTTMAPSTTTMAPSTTTMAPSTTEMSTTTTTEMPSTTTMMPSTTTTFAPSTTTEMPSTTTEMPSTTTEVPSTTTEMPSTTTEMPSTTTQMPSTTTLEPSTTASPSTTESPSSTSMSPSTTTMLPSTTTETPSTTASPSSTTMSPSTTEAPSTTTASPSTTTESPSTSTSAPTTTTSPSTTTTSSPSTTTASPSTTTSSPSTTTTMSPSTSTSSPTSTNTPSSTTTATPSTTAMPSTTSSPSTTHSASTTVHPPTGYPMIINASSTYTSGGTVTIFGENFGNNSAVIEVSLGPDACVNLYVENNMIRCAATAGVGKNWHVTVKVNGVANMDNNTAFSRIPPHVNNVQIQAPKLIIGGSNFGAFIGLVEVEIANYTCVVTEIDHTRLVCEYDMAADLSWDSWHELSVNVYGQATSYMVTPDEVAASSKLSLCGLLFIMCLFVSLFIM